jgi:hypothetical protein
MKKPNRKPDFCVGKNEFWIHPEMIWYYQLSAYNAQIVNITDVDGKLALANGYKTEVLWDEAQEAYDRYKKKLDAQIDSILLDVCDEAK